VVPRKQVPAPQLALFSPQDWPLHNKAESSPRIAWAALLKLVSKVDVTVCIKCGGHVRVLEAVTKKPDMRAQARTAGATRRATTAAPSKGTAAG